MTSRKEAKSKVEEITRNRRARITMLTRKSRRKMRTGRRHLPRKKKLTRRRSRDVPCVGASTALHGETTRNQTGDLAKTAPTSRMAALTKSQPKPPRQLSSIPSGRL